MNKSISRLYFDTGNYDSILHKKERNTSSSVVCLQRSDYMDYDNVLVGSIVLSFKFGGAKVTLIAHGTCFDGDRNGNFNMTQVIGNFVFTFYVKGENKHEEYLHNCKKHMKNVWEADLNTVKIEWSLVTNSCVNEVLKLDITEKQSYGGFDEGTLNILAFGCMNLPTNFQY